MTRLEKILAMPTSVLVMFGVFLVTPFLSLTFIELPWVVYAQEGTGRASLVVLTYWLGPLLLCYSILIKHHLFVPFYLLQCVALLAHSITYSNKLPLDIALARYVLIGFMAYIGVFFGNKDFLTPFLTKNFRMWRKHPRFRVSFEIHLVGDKPEMKIPALLENCSATGMAVSIEKKLVNSFVKKKQERDALGVLLRWQGQEFTLQGTIVWLSDSEATRAVGLHLGKSEALTRFVAWVKHELAYEARMLHASSPVLEHDVQQTALILWVLFIALSFGLPAFASIL